MAKLTIKIFYCLPLFQTWFLTNAQTADSQMRARVLRLYSGNTKQEVITSATALASERFTVYSTWKWTDLHTMTGGKQVYRYFSKSKFSLVSEVTNSALGQSGSNPGTVMLCREALLTLLRSNKHWETLLLIKCMHGHRRIIKFRILCVYFCQLY